jgi:hypothetical protein
MVTLACAIVWVIAPSCWADTCTWGGGTGGWEGSNWGCTNYPDHPAQPFDTDAVIIPSGSPVISFVEGINTLDVDLGAGITHNGSLSVHNGVINDGVITMADDAQFGIDVGALNGAGEVVLADSVGTYAAISGAPFGYTPVPVTHAAAHTIRGEGTVQGKWINNGLIRAEETSGDSTAELDIIGTMTNNGMIRSSATGHVYLVSLDLTMGATGQFIADGQPIQLGLATITGGTLQAINGAKFVRRADAGGTTVFSGVTINGDFDVLVTNAGIAGTGTGITNNGTITLDNLGVANAQFHMDAGSTLDGTGQLVLNRQNDSVHISGNFTHGASHTIRGVGRLHANIVNNGSILAEPKNGGNLLRAVDNPITNHNLLQANNGATFRLENAAVTQSTTGRVRAANGGTVELLYNSTVTGGKLQTEGTGIIVTPASNASVLVDVDNEGTFHTIGGATTRIRGTTLVNDGTMAINPSGANALTSLEFGSNLKISGSGSIVLNQTGNSARISFQTGSEIVTQSAGHTIRGRGLIDNGFGSGGFVNHGLLEGNSATEPLAIFTRLSGEGTLKNVTIGGGFIQIQHILGEIGTTAIVPVEGLYSFGRNSSLLVDLAGTTPGSGYDQLNSTGTITLSSTATRLEVTFANDFKPLTGSSFTLLTTTGSLSGNFGSVILPTLPLGLSWSQAQTATSFSIGVTGSLAADFDDDGDVDDDDLAIWQTGYNSGTLHSQGNADGDSDVDGLDFLIWQRSFGWGGQAPLAAAVVPEPSGMALLACLAIVVLRRRGGC